MKIILFSAIVLLMVSSSVDCFGTNRAWDMLDLSSRPDGGHHPDFATEMMRNYFLSREIEKEEKNSEPKGDSSNNMETDGTKIDKSDDKKSHFQKFKKFFKFW